MVASDRRYCEAVEHQIVMSYKDVLNFGERREGRPEGESCDWKYCTLRQTSPGQTEPWDHDCAQAVLQPQTFEITAVRRGQQ